MTICNREPLTTIVPAPGRCCAVSGRQAGLFRKLTERVAAALELGNAWRAFQICERTTRPSSRTDNHPPTCPIQQWRAQLQCDAALLAWLSEQPATCRAALDALMENRSAREVPSVLQLAQFLTQHGEALEERFQKEPVRLVSALVGAGLDGAALLQRETAARWLGLRPHGVISGDPLTTAARLYVEAMVLRRAGRFAIAHRQAERGFPRYAAALDLILYAQISVANAFSPWDDRMMMLG